MTHLAIPQGVVALDVGPGFLPQREGLRCVDDRGYASAVRQAVQDVEDVGLGGDTILER